MRKSCVGKSKVGEVRKIRSGKPRHHPYSFSFNCALTIISVSACRAQCHRLQVCLFLKTSVSDKETVRSFLLTSLPTTNDQKINNKFIAISISTPITDTHSFSLNTAQFPGQISTISTVNSWLADCTGFANFQPVLVQQICSALSRNSLGDSSCCALNNNTIKLIFQ